MDIKIEESWKNILSEEFEKPYFSEISQTIKAKIQSGGKIFPPGAKIFSAFDLCPFEKIKVVILGQDPYHTPGAAMGLCFGVPAGQRIPPSLQNIYKELQSDLGPDNFTIPEHGNLEKWAAQGVLLLNAALTVQQAHPNVHASLWAPFTDRIMELISEKKSGVVFILWGAFARSKKTLINSQKHFILESPHPSPFSAHNGFFGSRPFSQTNEILKKEGRTPINWQV